MERERHIDNGEAMRHNEAVEQARRAEHLRRCAQSPAYKRVYERWQEVNRKLAGEIQTVQHIICDQMQQQTAQPIGETMTSQPVKFKDRPDPLPPPEEQQRLAATGNPWTWFLLGMMFADEEKLKQMREDAVATQEMMEVNARYDRQMICMSGFEW